MRVNDYRQLTVNKVWGLKLIKRAHVPLNINCLKLIKKNKSACYVSMESVHILSEDIYSVKKRTPCDIYTVLLLVHGT
jgi:hypothetical protein